MIIFFCVSSILSCSNEENTELNDINKTEFFNELKAFNSNYQLNVIDKQQSQTTFSKTDDDNDECGFWCTVGQVVVVAGADLGGAAAGVKAVGGIATGLNIATGGTAGTAVAVAGGVIGGGAASILAADKLSDEKKTANKFGKKLYIKNLNIIYPKKYSYLSEVGKMHNEEVFNHYNNFSKKMYKNSDFEIIENSKEWKNAISKIENSVNNYVENDFKKEELTSSLSRQGLITEDIQNVLNVFYTIYNSSQQEKNIEDIVNFYINAISSTNILSEGDKEALIVAFSVASESPFYWLNQN